MPSKPLSDLLPPLIFGTATFNHQYNKDPFGLGAASLVSSAFEYGFRAFDTSPYYGPAEDLLGKALASISYLYSRDEYLILTKVGRISEHQFDYSPTWIRKSVATSLQRLNTPYLDVVYCHDVEFVSPEEVVAAVIELRRIRDDEGTINFVGISGYPVPILCELAQMVLDRTGEPLDVVMSYANFTVQNSTLQAGGLHRLASAGVGLVVNASVLAMGLLRQNGPPIGAGGDWHPAPSGLRHAVANAAAVCSIGGESLEMVSILWALDNWITGGRVLGTTVPPVIVSTRQPAADLVNSRSSSTESSDPFKFGVSVIGVSSHDELDTTMSLWSTIVNGIDGHRHLTIESGVRCMPHRDDWGAKRKAAALKLADEVRRLFGSWLGYAWPSPPDGFKSASTKV